MITEPFDWAGRFIIVFIVNFYFITLVLDVKTGPTWEHYFIVTFMFFWTLIPLINRYNINKENENRI